MKNVYKSLAIAVALFVMIIVASEIYRDFLTDKHTIGLTILLVINFLFITYYVIIQTIKSLNDE